MSSRVSSQIPSRLSLSYQAYRAHLDLPSFPTRRSSDLQFAPVRAGVGGILVPIRVGTHQIRHLGRPPAWIGAAVKISLHGLTETSHPTKHIGFPARIDRAGAAYGSVHGQHFLDPVLGHGLLERLRFIVDCFEMFHVSAPYAERYGGY